MPKINIKGLIVGIIAWIGFMIFMINKTSCLSSNTCGSDDLFMSGVFAIAMIAPSWLVAGLVSVMFD